jgi:hypothetical protein
MLIHSSSHHLYLSLRYFTQRNRSKKCEIIKHEFIKKLGYGCEEAAEKELPWIEKQIKQNRKKPCSHDSLLIPFNFVM